MQVFAGGQDVYEADTITNVEGSAVYSGSATGLYVQKGFDEQNSLIPTATGEFMADAYLMATFGGGDVAENEQFKMEGSVSNFRDGGDNPINPFWKVSLNVDDFENGMLVGDSWQGTFTVPMTAMLCRLAYPEPLRKRLTTEML